MWNFAYKSIVTYKVPLPPKLRGEGSKKSIATYKVPLPPKLNGKKINGVWRRDW